MEKITVAKNELLAKLEENRADHRRIFEEALEGFRAKVIRELDKLTAKVKAGDRGTVQYIARAPEDHTRDYDRVIAMLKMSMDDFIQLSEEDFCAYVQDDWGWQSHFLSNVYGSRSAKSKFSESYAVS